MFTLFCEQTLAAGRRFAAFFNPLLQPFLDKVVAELMILGDRILDSYLQRMHRQQLVK